MRVHPFSTGRVAVKARQLDGRGPGPIRPLLTMLGRGWTDPLPILAWIIEHPEGLIAVDSAETARATEPGYFPRWNPYFRFAVRLWVRPDDEVGPQMRAGGLDPARVRTVVLTHLHTDHAGGLAHFRNARIICSAEEHARATGPLAKASGYLPHRRPPGISIEAVELPDDRWGPFPHSMALTEAGDVRIIATPGHTPGHLSVAVEEDDGTVVFIAGDTSYLQAGMLDCAADGVTQDPGTARETLRRIRELAAARPTVYLPSHDPGSPERLAQRRPALGASGFAGAGV